MSLAIIVACARDTPIIVTIFNNNDNSNARESACTNYSTSVAIIVTILNANDNHMLETCLRLPSIEVKT